MAYLFSGLLNWLRSLFFAKHLEVTIVGLQASGKTSLVNVLGSDQWSEDVVPTVAFNMRTVRKGNVTMKVWDVAGQPKFRGMWDRYCRGADAIIYVVDAADSKSIPTATSELHALIALPALATVPLLVLANKNDLPEAISVDALIKEMRLSEIRGRAVSCYSTSNKTKHNLDIVLAWLTQRAH
ncbi:ADP-ribosylation factor family-domain-containing protein [Kockovaella imperatae]|uniref:ADP-ribosylation factor family-domain-containing protein n=1 Tax=Kockovaella imperatae TaxID=4999 RepID=A0A1Y1UM82_9TREE|nr:ADP-ribosylation factor family-domain-containing protein [Kockovaella imperatae]ORX38586.1 ADP-ribosylation factor family-domain-containing protein [Kockovaella imperatae]